MCVSVFLGGRVLEGHRRATTSAVCVCVMFPEQWEPQESPPLPSSHCFSRETLDPGPVEMVVAGTSGKSQAVTKAWFPFLMLGVPIGQ